jgi:hypothetical protein
MHTTSWFNALKADPVHAGSYETFAKSEGEVLFRRWSAAGWEPAFRPSDTPHWRGILKPEPIVEHETRQSTLFATSAVAKEPPALSVKMDALPD